MDDNLAIFLVITTAIVAAVVLIIAKGVIAARRHGPDDAAAGAGAGRPEDENQALRGQISRLEERLHVLERIAVDPAERTAHAIEQLR